MFRIKEIESTSFSDISLILKDLQLDDFESKNSEFNKFIHSIQSSPVDIKYYLREIESRISESPMLESVVSVSLGASNNIGQDEYRYFVNMIYVLDGMTELIINDINFFTEVESHFKNKRSDIER